MSHEFYPLWRHYISRGFCTLVKNLFLPVAVLILMTGFLGESLSGTWRGTGEEIVCGEKASRPIDVTLNLTQLAPVRDANSPAATDPLLEDNQNVKGELDAVGSDKTPEEHGQFVGSLDNAGNLNGRIMRARKPGEPPLRGVSTLLAWDFEVQMAATSGFFRYKKLSGTFTRSWQCPVAPGSPKTELSSDVINVELTRQQ
jgi:hypothetical protein